jgi:hypothetical protein
LQRLCLNVLNSSLVMRTVGQDTLLGWH